MNILTAKDKKQVQQLKKAAIHAANNSAFKKEEQRFLNIAKEIKQKKRHESFQRTQDLSKDLASQLCHISREAITLGGDFPLECLTCQNRVGHLDKCLPCKRFSNYKQKGG